MAQGLRELGADPMPTVKGKPMQRLWWGTFLALTLVACSSSSAPQASPVKPTSQLHITLEGAAAKPLLAKQVSFWPKVGEDRAVRLFYQGATAVDTGQLLLELEVPPDGLSKRPDGTAFQPGDSILITVTVVDTTRFLFDFQPAGLQFNPANPARLKIEYVNANHDFNGDGVIDARDVAIEADSLGVWRRDPPDTLWYRQFAIKFGLPEELDANVLGFSQYAVAW
jgi:hypothetical protein